MYLYVVYFSVSKLSVKCDIFSIFYLTVTPKKNKTLILVFTSNSHNIRDIIAKSRTLNFHGHCFDKILIGGLGAGQADSLELILSAVLGHTYTKHSHRSLALQQADCLNHYCGHCHHYQNPVTNGKTTESVSTSRAKIKKQPLDLL